MVSELARASFKAYLKAAGGKCPFFAASYHSTNEKALSYFSTAASHNPTTIADTFNLLLVHKLIKLRWDAHQQAWNVGRACADMACSLDEHLYAKVGWKTVRASSGLSFPSTEVDAIIY